MQSIIVPWNVQIFQYNTLRPLSNCVTPQTWKIWAKYRPGISDVIGYNRAVFKIFAAYHLFELVISRMSHARLHDTRCSGFLHLFLSEQAEHFANYLD